MFVKYVYVLNCICSDVDTGQFMSTIANKNSTSKGKNKSIATSNTVKCPKTDRTEKFVMTKSVPSRESNDNQNQSSKSMRYILSNYVQLIDTMEYQLY